MSGFGKKKPQNHAALEKRRLSRTTAVASATVSTTYSTELVRVVDLSAGGAGLLASTPPQKGRDVQLQVGEHKLFGAVAWKNNEGFGIKFEVPLGEHDLQTLDQSVANAQAINGVKYIGSDKIMNEHPSDD